MSLVWVSYVPGPGSVSLYFSLISALRGVRLGPPFAELVCKLYDPGPGVTEFRFGDFGELPKLNFGPYSLGEVEY